MKKLSHLDLLWLLLMGLTLGSAWLAESAESGLLVTVAVSVIIAIKGRIVVDYFMELYNANRHIRNWMMAYFYVLPFMIILVSLFPEEIAGLTALR